MIGVFDSGVGGLFALWVLRHVLPGADILYFADEAARPLGEKPIQVIRARVRAAVSLLHTNGACGVLAACGTAGSYLTGIKFPCPVHDIITPTARVLGEAGCRRILLLGTRATVNGRRFAAEIHRFTTHGCRLSLACPHFVPLSEGYVRGEVTAEVCRDTVQKTLAPFRHIPFDGVVLGCTHFSPLSPYVAAALPGARVFDAATLGALSFAAAYREAEKGGHARTRYLSTGNPLTLEKTAEKIKNKDTP